jgi:hypothetical protein
MRELRQAKIAMHGLRAAIRAGTSIVPVAIALILKYRYYAEYS